MVAGTMMMSPPPLMDLEQAFSIALPKIDRWSLTADRFELRGPDVELDFAPYDAPPEEPISSVSLP